MSQSFRLAASLAFTIVGFVLSGCAVTPNNSTTAARPASETQQMAPSLTPTNPGLPYQPPTTPATMPGRR